MRDLAAIHHADMLGEFAAEIKVLFGKQNCSERRRKLAKARTHEA
jgi:hypothetical protein